ncbi:hypothetical protein [Nisaea sediminum]|uniref:hypothetical protein n=1 Tax=Nisaea sediminum TaxID=2775867 RepID=UPI0018686782|nr:hypothetical protein [Nisaea sediminum]
MNEINSRDELITAMRKRPRERNKKGKEVKELMSDLANLSSHTEIDQKLIKRIAEVKSPRRAALVRDNDADLVAEAVRLAFNTTTVKSETIRISILTALRGVSVPTASAILAWREPKKWGVIDFRTWQVMNGAGLLERKLEDDGSVALQKIYGVNLSPYNWSDYIAKLRSLAKELHWKPQQVDQWMFWWHKDHRDSYPQRPKKVAQ